MTEVVDLRMTPRPCDICGGSDVDAVWAYEHVVRTRNRRYRFRNRNVVCGRCGFAFVSPVPRQEDLDAYYRDAFSKFQGQPPGYAIEGRMQVLKRFGSPQARFLEVGCNAGGPFARACDDYFASTLAVELNDECERSADSMGDLADGCCDLVAHYYVLEHLADPTQLLRSCRRVLARNGIMVVEVPDLRRYPHQASELIWWEHVSHFCRETLDALARREGFEPLPCDDLPASHHNGLLAAFRHTDDADGRAAPPDCRAEALACLADGRGLAARLADRIEHLRERIGKATAAGAAVTIWGANDLTRRLCAALPAADAIVVVDDDGRKHAYLDDRPVRAPESVIDHLRATGLLVICSARLADRLHARASALAGRVFDDIEVLDYDHLPLTPTHGAS